MRKFLSVIMVVAMLVTSILPAIANVAAADGAFTYNVSTDGFVDNGDGTATAKVDFEITNNPGGVDALNIVLYYTNGEIETGDYVYPEVYADYSDGTDNKVSTNRNLKSYFAYAGISTASDLYGTSFEVILEGDGTIDDEGVYATFDVIALDADAVASGAEYTYGFIVQALDVDGEEIAVDPVYTEYKLAAKPADPYATTHDVETFPEDQFTINLTGAHVYENAFVEGEIPTADVNVEFHGNTEANNPFGVWGFRCFVTYPAELTAVGYTNGDIFKDAEMMKFEDCATNLDVTAELEKDEVVRIVQDAVKGFEYVGYETYATDGIKVSVIQYLGTNWYDVTYGDGLVQTITFQLPEDAAAGDRWDIGICANGTGDVCHNGGSTPDDQHPDLEPAPIAAAYNNGYIEVVSVKEETFEDFTFSTEDITVSADRETVDVKINVSGNTAEVNPYGFWGARLFVYYPADLAITNIAQGAIVPEGGFTLGRYNVNLPELIEAEPTNQVATAAPLAFADKGFDWENEDFRVTCIYFQAPTDADCIVKNGHYATITFELPEGAVAGDSWYVNIATCYNNADVNGYKADPSLSTSIVEKLTHALDDGSITIGGDAVVEPEPPAAHEHVLEYTAAVEAGCHYTGNTEYWYCAGCDTVFADAEATQITNRKNVIIPAKGSNLLVHMDAVEAGCHYDGNVEYWICYECEQVWADEALTQLTNIKNVVLPAVGSENLHHVDYLAPTYEANGNIEYWYCDDCGQVWQDEALTQLTNRMNVIIPMLTKATVVVGTDTVVKGEEANVAITLDNNPGLFIGKFVITYDASVLTLVEATNGDLFADDNVIITAEEGKITLYFENNVVADVVANGVLANLVFATDAEGEPAEVALEIVADAENNINVAGEDVAIDVVAGKVNVINCAHEGTTLTPNQVKAPTVYEEGIMEYICECGEVAYTEAIAKLAGFEFGSAEMTAGDTVASSFIVSLLNNPGVWSFSATFAYDANVLEFVSVDAFENMLFTVDEYSYSVADGVITVYFESTDLNNIEGDGHAFMLAFSAISCGYSDIDAELVADNTINAAGENVAFEAIDGYVFAKCALTHVDYVAPTATEGGMQEYWYCEYCGAVYADAEGRYITNRMNLYIPPVAIQLDSWIEVNEGEQAKVAVDLVSNPGVWSLGLKVAYDADNLAFAGIESGLFEIDDNSYSVADGVITIFVENAEIADIVENGTAFTLVFDTVVGGYYDIDAELVAENTINAASENVEFGVNDGAITVIHVCDLEYFAAVEASCHQNGMLEYWYCEACDSVYADAEGTIVTNRKNLTVPYTAEIVHVEAVEPGCHYDGNVEYWYCADCQAVFTDAALTQLSNFKNVIVPATGSENLVHFDAVEAGCHYTGNIEYWFCPDCEQYWQDEALTQLTNSKNVIIPAKGSDLFVHMDAVEPGCHYDGNVEYWICYECEQVWADEALTQLTNIKNVVVPAIGSENLQHVEAVAPTCNTEGNIEYWYCPDCECYWQDEALTQLTNAKNVILGTTEHNIIHFDAVEPGCHYNGNIEYWFCSICEGFWADEALTMVTNSKSVILPATGAEVTHVAAVEASCHQNGNIEYWYCESCEQVWQDEALTQLTNIKNVVVPATAEIIYVEAVEPTCCQTGNYEYWYCSECDAVFADAALTQLTNRRNLTIAATAEIIYVEAVEATCHQNGSAAYYYCSECDAVYDEDFILTNRKNLTIPYTAEIIYVEAVEPTCCQTGNYEYWYCSECDAVFADAALTQLTNRRNLTIAATAEIIYVEAVEASCHQNGSAAYYYCSECDAVYDEDFILTNRKNLTIPYTAEIIHVDAVEAVCHQTGNVEYWYCSECDAVFTDAALTQLSNFKSVITPAPVALTYVEAVAATCTDDGNVEYWYCSECDAVFADAMGAVITNYKNVVVPALGHVAGDKVVTVEPTETTEGAWEIRCTVCGELLESGTIAKTAFITKASGTDYVKSVVLEGDVITVVARPNAPYVKVAVGYDKGIEIASDNLTIFYYTYSYLNINNGESATIIATNADGDTKEYTVVVEWTNEAYTSYVGGYTTTDVQVSDETFNVYVKPNMNNASIGFVVTEGTTYVADEGLEVVLSGGKVYFKALESAADDSYTVVFTTRAGVEVVVTINFIFDYAEVSGAQGGGMVDGLELASGNVINITVNDKYAYASFRFVLKNTTSSIIAEEGVDVVLDRGISWFKIYNDGTDAVTKTFVVTNNANGVVDTYTVNVAFGSDN